MICSLTLASSPTSIQEHTGATGNGKFQRSLLLYPLFRDPLPTKVSPRAPQDTDQIRRRPDGCATALEAARPGRGAVL